MVHRLAFLLVGALMASIPTRAPAQVSTDKTDLVSLILIQRDLFDAQKIMTICDVDEDGFRVGTKLGRQENVTKRTRGFAFDQTAGSTMLLALRKVEAALDNHPEHATYLLRLFREIYDVVDEARGMSSSDLSELRQRKSVPLWNAIRAYLDTQMSDILKDDKITDARNYIMNQWDHLTEHLSDGEIPIDNNQCEQLMKQVALGRKNWLFVGSIGSGYRTATLLTIVSSAIRNDLDVAAYLEDVLDQLLSCSKDYESLRPDAWAKSHPDSIRAHRQKEREANNTRRDRERLRRRIARTET